MALNIQTTLELPQGITIADAYGRVAVVNQVQGNFIQAAVSVYVNEQAFVDGKAALDLADLTLGVQFPYDYETDSKDILDLGHDALIAKLAEQGITATKNL